MRQESLFKRRKDEGFTLVELLWVTSFIFVVLMAAFFIAETGFNVSRSTTAQVQAQSDARQAERIITRYLRQAKTLDASKVTDYNLGFYAEVDGDEKS
jgi:type II secretory pathway component PulJ